MVTHNDQLAQASPESAVPWPVGDDEAPVFVDQSGRRAHRVRVVGAAMTGLCALWLAGLVIGAAGFSGFPVGRASLGGLATLVRSRVARATTAQLEARELASGPSVTARARVS
jgi:hypothetical protein